MLAIEFLKGAGFQVDTAGSAAEAMNKLGLIPGGVDAVIVDIGSLTGAVSSRDSCLEFAAPHRPRDWSAHRAATSNV
jgi:DNA-binding response OmpR family regulator